MRNAEPWWIAETLWAMPATPTPSLMTAMADASCGTEESGCSYRVVSGVAVIPVTSMLVKRPSFLTMIGWATSCDELAEMVQRAAQDGNVRAIVLDIDSPGGRVSGVPDCGDAIFEARLSKPIHAIANDSCCSAAYYLGSAAEKLWCTQSATVGSIGTKLARLDLHEANKLAGLKWTVFQTGSLKSAGDPDVPLSDEEKTFLQGWVDGIQQGFVEAVARNRGISPEQVREKFGDARFWMGQEAVSVGLCDGVTTLDRLVSSLAGIDVNGIGDTNNGEGSGDPCEPDEPGNPGDDSGCGPVRRAPGIRIGSR